MTRFDADQMLARSRIEGITWMFAVPTMLRRLSTSTELPRLARFVVGLPDAGR